MHRRNIKNLKSPNPHEGNYSYMYEGMADSF